MLRQAGVFGMQAEPARTEDVVTDVELADRRTNRFDDAGDLDSERARSRPAKPGDETPEHRMGAPDVRVRLADRRRSNPDQDLVVLRGRLIDLLDAQHLRWSVSIL